MMAIRETEKGYYVEVYLGKDPLTNKKIRKTKLFEPLSKKTLKEAKLWEAGILTSYKTGELDLKGSMKLSEYLDYWFDTYVITNTAYQTQKRYKTLCGCIKKQLGHLPLEKIKAPIIERFYSDLKKEMRILKNGNKKRRYMDGTILKTHKVLHQALDKAVAWDMIAKNPAAYATSPEDDNRTISYWSIEEATAFLEAVRDKKIYLPAFIAYHTGLREGEICALRWQDVHLKEGYLEVNNNMVQKEKKLALEDPKTEASKASVALTSDLTKVLEEEYRRQVALSGIDKVSKVVNIKDATKKNENKFTYVCSWDDCRPLRPLYVTKAFTSAVKALGCKKITFHGLRHTHATILYSNGARSQEISKRLRHSRVSTTDDIYIHVNEDIKKSTAELFSTAVNQVK
jgi:integrase